jgi:hypothetical protein
VHSSERFHTRHDNFFTVELIDAQRGRVEYTVYFKLSRAPSRGRLNLYVQSAATAGDGHILPGGLDYESERIIQDNLGRI